MSFDLFRFAMIQRGHLLRARRSLENFVELCVDGLGVSVLRADDEQGMMRTINSVAPCKSKVSRSSMSHAAA